MDRIERAAKRARVDATFAELERHIEARTEQRLAAHDMLAGFAASISTVQPAATIRKVSDGSLVARFYGADARFVEAFAEGLGR